MSWSVIVLWYFGGEVVVGVVFVVLNDDYVFVCCC